MKKVKPQNKTVVTNYAPFPDIFVQRHRDNNRFVPLEV